jgi:hypothetical protein
MSAYHIQLQVLNYFPLLTSVDVAWRWRLSISQLSQIWLLAKYEMENFKHP